MKLYDMDKEEWRKFERGDCWRSNAIRECAICYVKTNDWVMGGHPGTGPRLICPGNRYQEHNEIEAYLTKSYNLGLEIKFFEKILNESPELDGERSQNMLDNLSVQKELLEVLCRIINPS
jgi:hypothetical protein